MWIWFPLACTQPKDRPPDHPTRIDTGAPTPTIDTGTTGGSTPTSPPTSDCDNLPIGPVPISSFDITTTEDFDFDALGYLVYSDGGSFRAADAYGGNELVAPGIQDTRGIRILSDGNVIAAYITEGRVGFTDRTTGGGNTLISGLSGPNALEVGAGDLVFVSETGGAPRVRAFDRTTLEETTVAGGFLYPNGLALSPDEQTLYVADSYAGIYKVAKDPGTGEWGERELLFDPADSYDGIETDRCGNVYTVGFTNGQVVRFNPETLESTLLYDIDDPAAFLFNAMRWGSGRGGWRRDVLYITDRRVVFALEVGIEGPPQAVDNVP